MKNFDPFLDWSKIGEDEAGRLRELSMRQRAAHGELADSGSIEAAVQMLKCYREVQETITDMFDSIWTVPVIVHIADRRSWEKNPDDPEQEAVLQRCARCKTVLQWWYPGMVSVSDPSGMIMISTTDPESPLAVQEEDYDWWPIGSTIAKQAPSGYEGIYVIEDRPLHSHEVECAGFTE